MQLVKDYVIAVPEPATVGAPRWCFVLEAGPDVKHAKKNVRILVKPGSGLTMMTNDGSKRVLLTEGTDLIGFE